MTSGAPGTPRRAPAIRTFLIADIRGYTRFTAQHGDEAASRLARRFAEVAAEGVEAWGGELVELRGDEALAVFDSARQALRCAVELQDAFADETAADPSLPLNVGIGLDAGEAVPVDDGYRGAALNLGARLCAAAAGGEVLASATILNLAGPVPGLAIGDVRPRTVKGLEQQVDAALVGDGAPAPRASAVATTAAAESAASALGLPTLPAELEPVVPLAGRVAELRWLRWHWRRARHGHGRTVIVSGPPGIGKTRLAAELATLAHADGAWADYLPSGHGVDTAGDGLAAGVLPSLVVADDLDAASVAAQQAVVDLAQRITGTSTLLLVIHREEAAAALLVITDRLAPAERRRGIGPLGPDEIRAIAALYAGAGAEQAPIHRLMDESGGVPAAAHRAAASWARSVATGRLATTAERTETGRRDLRAAQSELIGNVATLEQITERTRRYDPDGPGAAGSNGVTVCPYKGLAAFDAVDAEYFFGRDRLVAELVAKLVGNPFLGFVGASGSGKSSAVRAGLLPALAGGVLPGSDRWVQVLMRPGEHPVEELRRALARAFPDSLESMLDAADPIAAALGGRASDEGLVLAVDQFEELFRATRAETERGAFIDLLMRERPGVRIVVTLRADHYGHCADYPALARMISATHVLVGSLTPAELEAVIEAPAERVGLRVEPELVRALVADAGSEPAALPLLSTSLLELWQARRAGWLTLDAYRAGGGLHGAIARLAESAYAELDPGQAAVARSMFLRLTGPGEGEGVVRRRVALAELGEDSDPVVARVLETLTTARLLTVGDGYIEVAHEALLREWPRLQAWLDEDAEGRKLRLHLIGAASDWDQRGREPADLYRGARLTDALDWAAEHQVELNATERGFLEASRTTAEREVERERRTIRGLRALLGGAGVLLVVAVAAGGLALTQADAARQQADLAGQRQRDAEGARSEAESAARLARSRELAASAVNVIDEDPALSKLLAVSAAGLDPTGLEIESVLHRVAAADRTIARWPLPGGNMGEVATDIHPDGRHMAVAWGPPDAPLAQLSVVDMVDGSTTWSYDPEAAGAAVGSPSFSPDGSRVVTGVFWAPKGDAKGQVPPRESLGIFIFDTETGQVVDRIDTGPCGADLWSAEAGTALVHIMPDQPGVGSDCFEADVGSTLQAVNLKTGERRLLGTDTWDFMALSADGRYAAFTDDTGEAGSIVEDLSTGKHLLKLPTDGTALGQRNAYVRALSADGSLLLYGDRPPKLFDVASGKEVASLDLGAGEHFGASFSPSGKIVYLSGRDSIVSAWDARSGQRLLEVPGAGGGDVTAADDRVLVEDWTGSTVALVDSSVKGEAGAAATCRGFSYGGQLQVVAGIAAFTTDCGDGMVPLYVIDASSMATLSSMPESDGQDIAVSPDGRTYAAQSSKDGIMGPIRIFDARTGRPLVQLAGLCSWDENQDFDWNRRVGSDCRVFPETPFALYAQQMTYSPDGRFVAAEEIGVSVWDTKTGRLLANMADPPDDPVGGIGLQFTPDSKELIRSSSTSSTCELIAISTDTWQVTRRADIDRSVGGCNQMGLVGFSADGSLIGISGVGGTGGGWLHRIDPVTLAIRSSNRAHDGSPKSFGLSPDGRLVVTGASDGVVRVWDAASGAQLHQLSVDGQAQGVAFVGEHHVAVAPSGGGLLVFDIDPASLLARVRASIIRGFTPEECQRFGFEDHCPTLDELRGTAP